MEDNKYLSLCFEEMAKGFEDSLNNYRFFINKLSNVIDEFNKIYAESISKIKIPEFPKIDNNSKININFLILIHQIKYPLYLEDNIDFKKQIVKCGDNIEQIEKTIFNYFNNEYLDKIVNYWKKSNCINKDRWPLLKEAVELHKLKFYYGSTSIMMCQLIGVGMDIYHFLERNEFKFTEELKKYLVQENYIDEKNIDSEKGKLFQIISLPEGGSLIKDGIISYFKDEILSSQNDKEKWEHQPLRHKICHGVQLNYGTKAHSLKAIMCIDLLYKLGDWFEKMINNNI